MNWLWRFIKQLFLPASFPRTHWLKSHYLARKVRVDLYLPKGFTTKSSPCPCFIFNDGQDLPRMTFGPSMQQLLNSQAVPPFAVAGIYAADRMLEYGTAGQPDYARRGDRAKAYEDFIRQELLPWLRQKYGLALHPEHTSIAGFSLGGLSAFDLLWRNPDLFHNVGVFSGALWWRSTDFDPKHPDADRIAHHRVAKGSYHPKLRFWFQTGTEDETADRNKNGIIDAIDDTLHLIEDLEKLGYKPGKNIRYLEIEGGRHEPHTWGQAMPDFIRWILADTTV